MSGSNQATNLTGMLNQIGSQLGKERDISGLTRNIQNMSRPSGMFGGPEPGTDEYDQQLMNWQTKMGRPQEAAVTQAAMKQRQANALEAKAAATTAGDNAFVKSLALASANLEAAATSEDPTAYTQALAEYNKVASTAATTGQFDAVRTNGTQVDRFNTNAKEGANKRDHDAYSNVKARQKAINQIPPERRTPQQVAELEQIGNRVAELEAKNPEAVNKYYDNLNKKLDAEGKQTAAAREAGEEKAVAEGLKLLVEGKSGKEIQDVLADKYGAVASEAIKVITDAVDSREKWGQKDNEIAYVTAGAADLKLEVEKLRKAGDEASTNLADALDVSINLAESQKAGLPKTAVANIENAQNMLTAHLSGMALSRKKAEYQVAAEEAGVANRARGQATPENLGQAYSFLEAKNASFFGGYDPTKDTTTMNVLASDFHLVELGLLEHTTFEWDGEGPLIRDGEFVTRSGKSVAEAAANARNLTAQNKINAVNPQTTVNTRRNQKEQAETDSKTTVIGNVTITEKPQ